MGSAAGALAPMESVQGGPGIVQGAAASPPDHPHGAVKNFGGVVTPGGKRGRRGVGGGLVPIGPVSGIPGIIQVSAVVAPDDPHLVVENEGSVVFTAGKGRVDGGENPVGAIG